MRSFVAGENSEPIRRTLLTSGGGKFNAIQELLGEDSDHLPSVGQFFGSYMKDFMSSQTSAGDGGDDIQARSRSFNAALSESSTRASQQQTIYTQSSASQNRSLQSFLSKGIGGVNKRARNQATTVNSDGTDNAASQDGNALSSGIDIVHSASSPYEPRFLLSALKKSLSDVFPKSISSTSNATSSMHKVKISDRTSGNKSKSGVATESTESTEQSEEEGVVKGAQGKLLKESKQIAKRAKK